MAVQRQLNLLGQWRLDIPHARAIESGVAYDFDVVGQLMTKRVPRVVTGFTFLTAGAIGNDAEDLVLQVAGSLVIHFNATEAGSFFRVEDGRADETLQPTNPRVKGAFTPGAVNYVGIDLIREADDSTADDVQFLVPSTNTERSRRVPLSRSMDYRVMISTNDFTSTPGVCPLALVTTDASNQVTAIQDARWLMFRLGSGGSTPNAVNPFSWPGGRNESDPGAATIAGDRSIKSLDQWLAAAMTRIWEIGGGEFWYSLTADRNVKAAPSGTTVFATSQEAFEWTGTNLHWQALTVKFDNSNGVTNTIAAQTVDSAGLTDLADGQCIYVDLDRTQNTAVAATRGTLQTLGGSARPGQRWVLAWRIGTQVFIRDQIAPVGSLYAAATAAKRGTVKLTADSIDAGEVANPRVANVVFDSGSTTSSEYFATCEGISHNDDLTNNPPWGAGPRQLQIGRGTAAGDSQILLLADNGFGTIIQSEADWTTENPAVYIDNTDTANPDRHDNKTLELAGDDGTTHNTAHMFEVGGAIAFRVTSVTPETPVDDPPRKRMRAKIFFRTNGLASPNTRDQLCVMWFDGSVTPIAESPTY